MDQSDHQRQKLHQLIRNSEKDDYMSLSLLIGKNPSYIQQFMQRGTPKQLREEDRIKIANHFDIPDWELGGPQKKKRQLRDSGTGGIVLVPHYDIAASAGDGTFVDGENQPYDHIPFQRKWLNTLTSADKDGLVMLDVRGDSMYPTLTDGDQLLVDCTKSTFESEGIYVLRHQETLHVKRVCIEPGNESFTIKSDNSLYAIWRNVRAEDLNIIGRVIWTGRKL